MTEDSDLEQGSEHSLSHRLHMARITQGRAPCHLHQSVLPQRGTVLCLLLRKVSFLHTGSSSKGMKGACGVSFLSDNNAGLLAPLGRHPSLTLHAPSFNDIKSPVRGRTGFPNLNALSSST